MSAPSYWRYVMRAAVRELRSGEWTDEEIEIRGETRIKARIAGMKWNQAQREHDNERQWGWSVT